MLGGVTGGLISMGRVRSCRILLLDGRVRSCEILLFDGRVRSSGILLLDCCGSGSLHKGLCLETVGI